jgi:hypothetical protein
MINMIKNTGFYVEVISETQSRVIFSLSSDLVDKGTFEVMWKQLGTFIYGKLEKKDMEDQFRVRFTPIRGSSDENI